MNMKKELEEKIQKIADNETQYSILMVVRTFGSANIKTLAEVIGKTESTIFHHISEMIKEPKVIEMDIERTETARGKYYKLIPELLEKYQKDEEAHQAEIPAVLDELLKMSEKELYNWGIKSVKENKEILSIAKTAKKSLAYKFMINNIILNSFDKAVKNLSEGKEPVRKNIPFPGFSNVSLDMKISSPKHVIKITQLVNEFFVKLVELKTEIQKEMSELDVAEEDRIASYVQLFSGELGEFPFRNPK